MYNSRVNLILFRQDEIHRPLSLDDPRAIHILRTLKRRPGDELDVGVVDGPKGKARLVRIEQKRIILDFALSEKPPGLHPVTLIAGLPRPQIARRILREATVLGVSGMEFIATDRGEKSYSRSRLWSQGEYLRYLMEGAQQAFSTRLPSVQLFGSLPECLASHRSGSDRIALDNYEPTIPLREYTPSTGSCLLAVGSERGWSDAERDILRGEGFTLAGLGKRVLGVETACIAGISLILARLELM